MSNNSSPSGIWSNSYGYHKAVRIIFNIIIAGYVWLAISDMVMVLAYPMHENNETADNLFWFGVASAVITILSVIGLAHNKKFALWSYILGCLATVIFTICAFGEITYQDDVMERVLYTMGIVTAVSFAPLLYFLGRDILD